MVSMMAQAPVVGDVAEIGAVPLVWALERMTPTLWEAPTDESPVEREARRLAAVDILDDLLSEYTDEYAEAALCGGDR